MTTATANLTLLDAAPPASASAPMPIQAPVPAPELHADRSARLMPDPEADPLAELRAAVIEAEPSRGFVAEPQAEPAPALQADPSLRFLAEPQPMAEPAYAPEPAYVPEPVPAGRTRAAPVERKSWREQRAERRRRRVWLEEVLAWILVPTIVLGTWWFIDMALAALGTSPAAILNGLSAIVSAL